MSKTLSQTALTLMQSGVKPLITWDMGSYDYLDSAEVSFEDDAPIVLDTTIHISCTVTVGEESSQFSRRFCSTATIDEGSLNGSFGVMDDWAWNEWIELNDHEQTAFDYLMDNFESIMIPKWSQVPKELTQRISKFMLDESKLIKP